MKKAHFRASGISWLLLTYYLLLTSISPLASADGTVDPSRFLKVYPGVYTEREKPLVEKYLADNAALESRGEIDVKKLISGKLPKGTPGLGPVIQVTEEWLKYNSGKYNPDNPLFNNKAYATKAGFKDIPAYPVFGAHDDTFMVPFPPAARDTLLVSELNHDVRSYAPIYPGDTLYLVMNSRHLIDLTPPEGSIYRNVAIISEGSVYNQHGVKVNDVTFRVTESLKQYVDPSDAPENPSFMDVWESPNWMGRPAHYYTDEDWKRIKGIWKAETIRGAKPLYWEDVTVGERPTPTLDGPIEVSVAPVPPWGMGAGGSRTLKQEILNPRTFGKMVRGEKDGIYRLEDRSSYVPMAPKQDLPEGAPSPDAGAIVTTDIHKEGVQRSPLVNYMGRDLAMRHITNWMGDKGNITHICWSIMDPRSLAAVGKSVPANPYAEHWLSEVPGMEDRFVEIHGLTQDVGYVQSYVTAKYVEDDRFLVDLVWWIETIDGLIWLEGKTTVELPSRA